MVGQRSSRRTLLQILTKIELKPTTFFYGFHSCAALSPLFQIVPLTCFKIIDLQFTTNCSWIIYHRFNPYSRKEKEKKRVFDLVHDF